MCSGMEIEYRGKWKSENGKWTTETVCWVHWSRHITVMFAPRQHVGRRRIASKLWILTLAVACCATCGWGSPSKSNDPLKTFARACGVPSAIQQSPRIFASPDESSWQEYSSIKDIPRWPEWTESASVWLRSDSPTLVFVAGVGKDFTDYYYYCFNRQGVLIRVERQFRTAWRWGFTETISYDDKGNEEERTSSYFDTKNEQAIEPPEKSDLVTSLKIFRTVSSLPFFALLSAKDHHL